MKMSCYMLRGNSKLFNMTHISYLNPFTMFIFNFVVQFLNKMHFRSKIGDIKMLRPELTFFVILSTWAFHITVSSIINPSDFVV